MPNARLGVGFVGSGFNARFHIQAWRGVRDSDVLGVWSPNAKNADARSSRWMCTETTGWRSSASANAVDRDPGEMHACRRPYAAS